MKIIYGAAGSGKTRELIKLASMGGYKLIVCHSRDEARRIFNLSMQMLEDKEIEKEISFPITYWEFSHNLYFAPNVEAVLIDNADMFLRSISSAKIEAISLTKEE